MEAVGSSPAANTIYADVAQLAEHLVAIEKVEDSNSFIRSNKWLCSSGEERHAVTVEVGLSECLRVAIMGRTNTFMFTGDLFSVAMLVGTCNGGRGNFAVYIGVWCNGSMRISKIPGLFSIRSTPAI